MRVLVVSGLGSTMALALRLSRGGHDVQLYTHSPADHDVGKGLVESVPDWRPFVKRADLVVVDDVYEKIDKATPFGGGTWAQEARRTNGAVIGGTPLTDRLENDRMFAQGVFEKVGMDTVPMHRFRSFADGKAFVKRSGGAWALKHNNQVSRDLASVKFDPGEMVEFIEWLASVWPDLEPGKPVDFVLQEAVKGCEIAVTAPFDGQRFWPGWAYVNREWKKLMDGDLAATTGQMGEMGAMQTDPRLHLRTLALLEPLLSREGYRGFFDVNCIVTEDGRAVPLEVTARFGYPSVWSFLELTNGDPYDLLHAMATDGKCACKPQPGYVCTVRVSSGTYPDADPVRNKHLVLRGWDVTGLDHVWLDDVQWTGKRMESAGTTGLLANVTQRGKTIQDAVDACYATVRHLDAVPFTRYRTDIGKTFPDEWAKLRAGNWVNP